MRVILLLFIVSVCVNGQSTVSTDPVSDKLTTNAPPSTIQTSSTGPVEASPTSLSASTKGSVAVIQETAAIEKVKDEYHHCTACPFESDHNQCNDPFKLSKKFEVSADMCNVINTDKAQIDLLCKRYPKGYFFQCPKDGSSYTCKASCGVQVEDVGKGLLDADITDMPNGLLSGINFHDKGAGAQQQPGFDILGGMGNLLQPHSPGVNPHTSSVDVFHQPRQFGNPQPHQPSQFGNQQQHQTSQFGNQQPHQPSQFGNHQPHQLNQFGNQQPRLTGQFVNQQPHQSGQFDNHQPEQFNNHQLNQFGNQQPRQPGQFDNHQPQQFDNHQSRQQHQFGPPQFQNSQFQSPSPNQYNNQPNGFSGNYQQNGQQYPTSNHFGVPQNNYAGPHNSYPGSNPLFQQNMFDGPPANQGQLMGFPHNQFMQGPHVKRHPTLSFGNPSQFHSRPLNHRESHPVPEHPIHTSHTAHHVPTSHAVPTVRTAPASDIETLDTALPIDGSNSNTNAIAIDVLPTIKTNPTAVPTKTIATIDTHPPTPGTSSQVQQILGAGLPTGNTAGAHRPMNHIFNQYNPYNSNSAFQQQNGNHAPAKPLHDYGGGGFMAQPVQPSASQATSNFHNFMGGFDSFNNGFNGFSSGIGGKKQQNSPSHPGQFMNNLFGFRRR